jgi:hypothetical protein
MMDNNVLGCKRVATTALEKRSDKQRLEALTPAFQDEEQEVTMLLFFFDP